MIMWLGKQQLKSLPRNMAPFRKISKFFNQVFSTQTGVEVASSTLMEGIDDDPMEGIESTTVDDGKILHGRLGDKFKFRSGRLWRVCRSRRGPGPAGDNRNRQQINR